MCLRVQFEKDAKQKTSVATAFMIHENIAITIADVLLFHDGLPKWVTCYSGLYNERVYRTSSVTHFIIPQDYFCKTKNKISPHNYAILYLENSMGKSTGYFSPSVYHFNESQPKSLEFNIPGYPAYSYKENKPVKVDCKHQYIASSKKISEHEQDPALLRHGISTTLGQNGAPILLKHGKSYRFVGIHLRGAEGSQNHEKSSVKNETDLYSNIGIKVTKSFLNQLEQFSNMLLNAKEKPSRLFSSSSKSNWDARLYVLDEKLVSKLNKIRSEQLMKTANLLTVNKEYEQAAELYRSALLEDSPESS